MGVKWLSKYNLLRSIKKYLKTGHTEIYDALAVETTLACDHNACPYCYMDCTPGSKVNMTMGTAKAIAAALRELEICPKEIWLPGGEPMLSPRLHETIEVLAPYSNYFALITNGQKLSDQRKVEELLSNPKIKEVAVSLHSADQTVHNWMVGHNAGSPAFERAMKAIVLLSQEKSDLVVSLNVNMNNGVDLDRIVERIEMRGGRVDKVMLQVVDFGTGRASRIPMKDELRLFCTPTSEMVDEYFDQANALVSTGKVRDVALIDTLPADMLRRAYDEGFYKPSMTPAIGVSGIFRANVLRRFE